MAYALGSRKGKKKRGLVGTLLEKGLKVLGRMVWEGESRSVKLVKGREKLKVSVLTLSVHACPLLCKIEGKKNRINRNPQGMVIARAVFPRNPSRENRIYNGKP